MKAERTKSSRRTGLVQALRWLLRAFFRSVEVTGLENVPAEGGGIIVAWHPQRPRRRTADSLHVPAARGLRRSDTVCSPSPAWASCSDRWGACRSIGARTPTRQRARSNEELPTRTACETSRPAATESFVGIFPEGVTHDEPQPLELRYGAARLYYAAADATSAGGPPPSILPVGLHYDKKHAFRSRALVVYHPGS